MKKIYLLNVLLFCVLTLSAQHLLPSERPMKKSVIKNISIALGNEMDMIYGLSQEQLVSMIKGTPRFEYETLEFSDKDLESMICENPTLSISMGIQPRSFKNGYFEVSARAIWDRVDFVSYHKQVTHQGRPFASHIDFNSRSNEANVGLAYIHHLKALNTFGLKFGAGSNIGYSFGNQMTVSGSNVKIQGQEIDNSGNPIEPVMYDQFHDSYSMKNSLYNRVYVEGGLDITILNKVTLGAVYRFGYGVRTTFGNGEIDAIKNQSIRLFAAYQL
jgi:hypothetical protein